MSVEESARNMVDFTKVDDSSQSIDLMVLVLCKITPKLLKGP